MGIVIVGFMFFINILMEYLIGMNGFLYKNGVIIIVWEVILVLVLVVVVMYFMFCYFKMGLIIILEFLEKWFDGLIRILIVLFLIIFFVFILFFIVFYIGVINIESIFEIFDFLNVLK